MALVISDEILAKAQLSSKELLIDLSCYLFDKRKLSMGRAKALAGLNQLDFQKELAARNIEMPLDEVELNHDLKTLGFNFKK